MSVVTLTFNLPEEDDECRAALHAWKLVSGLQHAQDCCRRHFKYDEPNPDTAARALEDVRGIINETLAGVNL
jgi:hypothetical protein